MSRRVVLFIALLALAVLGAAAAPWTLTGNSISTAVTEHMKQRYGVDFRIEGRSTFALLPVPRVKFEDVTLQLPGQTLRAEDATLRGELRLLPLLFGRIDLSEIALSGARITGSLQALKSLDWAEILKGRPDIAYADRVIVTGSSLGWTDLKDADLGQIDLVAAWSGRDKPLHLTGSFRWRDETVSIEHASAYPDLLAADRLSPFSLAISVPSGRIGMSGEALIGDDPQITGESTVEATSLRDFVRWSGMELPLGPLVQALSIKGEFSMNRRRLTWPSVALSLGADKLEGTMVVRLDMDRPLITGTLAADKLDLSDLFSPFLQARTSSGAWSEEAIDLAHATSGNLDLRLSASTAQIEHLRLEDMAASVLVRPGQIEASIGRAEFHGGTLKGRLSVAEGGDAVEFKSQGTFAKVDVAPLLAAIGEPRWITGRAQGQFLFEGLGQTPAEIVRRGQGRSSISVQKGELVGIALDDALQRVEKRPLLASLNWKGGRTPFSEAQTQLVVKDGVGEVVEGRLTSPTLQATLQGQVLLVDRALKLNAGLSSTSASADKPPVISFDIDGGWDNVVVTPNARALIERSGAAKPLFGSDRVSADAPVPQASAH